MIVLDTNVLPEALKPTPEPTVFRWLASQEASGMFTTAITQAEMLPGIEALPVGKRRAALLENVERMFVERFDGKVLPFDGSAARISGKITAARNSIGRPISQFDAMIAAIARAHHFTVASRDIAGFQHCGVRVIDPWANRS